MTNLKKKKLNMHLPCRIFSKTPKMLICGRILCEQCLTLYAAGISRITNSMRKRKQKQKQKNETCFKSNTEKGKRF